MSLQTWLCLFVGIVLSAHHVECTRVAHQENQNDLFSQHDLDASPFESQPLSAAAEARAVKERTGPGINVGAEFQPLIAEPTAGAAYLMVDWAPGKEDALKVEGILKGTHWPGFRREHGTIQTVKDFVWLYTGSGVYAKNVERCTRGAVALNPGSRGQFASMGTVADIFGGDPIEATAKAIQFTAGLCAALALIPPATEPQTLFRGALEPTDIGNWLQGYIDRGDIFQMPGLASTTLVKEHAISFMGKGPYRHRPSRGVNVLYEYQTKQAKDVRDVNPDENEWILPPNRKFKVVSATEVQKGPSNYLHVKLVDAI